VNYFEKIDTGEFAMKIKPGSSVNYCLTDKPNNHWEASQKEMPHLSDNDVSYFSVPLGFKGSGYIAAKNEKNKSVGRIQVIESNNPTYLGRPTRLLDVSRDHQMRLYAEYRIDDADLNAGLGRSIVVFYTSKGVALGRYQSAPGDSFLVINPSGEKSEFYNGDWYFVRAIKERELYDVLKVGPTKQP
jgi:hypothetical protein